MHEDHATQTVLFESPLSSIEVKEVVPKLRSTEDIEIEEVKIDSCPSKNKEGERLALRTTNQIYLCCGRFFISLKSYQQHLEESTVCCDSRSILNKMNNQNYENQVPQSYEDEECDQIYEDEILVVKEEDPCFSDDHDDFCPIIESVTSVSAIPGQDHFECEDVEIREDVDDNYKDLETIENEDSAPPLQYPVISEALRRLSNAQTAYFNFKPPRVIRNPMVLKKFTEGQQSDSDEEEKDKFKAGSILPLPEFSDNDEEDDLQPAFSTIVEDGKTVYKCLIPRCEYSTEKEKCIKFHARKTHDPSAPYPCHLCSCRYPTESRRLQHISSIHQSQQPLLTENESDLTTEIKIVVENGRKYFKCAKNLCMYKAPRIQALRVHEQAAHSSNNAHQCPHCSCRYGRQNALTDHLQRFHSDKKPREHNSKQSVVTKKKKNTLTAKAEKNISSLLRPVHVAINGRKNYKCPLCKQTNTSRVAIERHMKAAHKPEGKFSCHLCSCRYSRRSELTQHIMLIHSASKGSILPKITKSTNETAEDDVNLPEYKVATSNGKRMHACSACDFKTASRRNIKIHLMKAHDESARFKCHLCSCRYHKSLHLTKHITREHSSSADQGQMQHQHVDEQKFALYTIVRNEQGNKRLKCKKCAYITAKLSAITLHTKSAHNRSNKHRCSFCSCRYQNLGRLKLHINLQHNGAKMSSSDKRIKTLADKITTNRIETDSIYQLKYENGVKYFKCTVCSYIGYRLSSILNHAKRKHKKGLLLGESSDTVTEGETSSTPRLWTNKVFKCQFCTYFSVAKHNLNRHMQRSHNQKAEFQCGLCECRYFTQRSLQQHMMQSHHMKGVSKKIPHMMQSLHIKGASKKIPKLVRVIREGQSEFKCSIKDCDFSKKNVTQMKWHLQHAHDPLRNIQCGLCSCRFKSHIWLDRHCEEFHSGESSMASSHKKTSEDLEEEDPEKTPPKKNSGLQANAIKCMIPGCVSKKYYSLSSINLHLKVAHSPTGQFKCSLCPCRFNYRKALASHGTRFHTPQCQTKLEEEFTEDVPKFSNGKIFKKPVTLKINKSISFLKKCGIRRHKCNMCSYAAMRPDYLRNHKKVAHSTKGGFQCQLCSCCFLSKRSWTKHSRIHIPLVRLEKIDEKLVEQLLKSQKQKNAKPVLKKSVPLPLPTRKVFGNKTKPWYMKRYLGKKAFEIGSKAHPSCVQCGRVFQTDRELKAHSQVVHSGNNTNYPCGQCGFVFEGPGGLKRHITMVHKFEQADEHQTGTNEEYLQVTTEEYKPDIAEEHHTATLVESEKSLEDDLVGNDVESSKGLTPRSRMNSLQSEQQFNPDIPKRKSSEIPFVSEAPKEVKAASIRNNAFSCSKCSFSTWAESGLQNHDKRSHVENGIACEYCPCSFLTRFGLKQHIRFSHKSVKNSRLMNGFYTNKKQSSEINLGKPRCGNPDENVDINESENKASDNHLKENQKNHEGITEGKRKEYRCSRCDYTTTCEPYLIAHSKVSHIKGGLRCPYCSCTFAYRLAVTMHVKRFHKSISSQLFSTAFQNKKTETKDCVANTVEYYNSNEESKEVKRVKITQPTTASPVFESREKTNKTLYCQKCPFRTQNIYFYSEHIKAAHVENGYVCNDCPCAYATENGLKTHKMRRHKRLVPPHTNFKTSQAGKQALEQNSSHEASEENLSHEATEDSIFLEAAGENTNENIFKQSAFSYHKCEFCNEVFGSKTVFIRHVKRCSSEKFEALQRSSEIKKTFEDNASEETDGKNTPDNTEEDTTSEQALFDDQVVDDNSISTSGKDESSTPSVKPLIRRVTKVKCKSCPKVFRSPRALQSHKKEEHNNSTECEAQSPFVQKQKLPVHYEIQKRHKCDQCACIFNTKEELKSHSLIHAERKKKIQNVQGLAADEVNEGLNYYDEANEKEYESSLNDKSVTNKNVKTHFCPGCDYKTDIVYNLAAHMKTSHTRGSYGCNVCKCIFESKIDLIYHKSYFHLTDFFKKFAKAKQRQKQRNSYAETGSERRIHSCGATFSDSLDSIQCKLCKHRFNNDSIHHHLQFCHCKLSNAAKCDQCPCSFDTNKNLSHHVKWSHKLKPSIATEKLTGSKPVSSLNSHRCQKCGFSFETAANLTAHHATSHVHNKYSCVICSCGFQTRFQFDGHMSGAHNLPSPASTSVDEHKKVSIFDLLLKSVDSEGNKSPNVRNTKEYAVETIVDNSDEYDGDIETRMEDSFSGMQETNDYGTLTRDERRRIPILHRSDTTFEERDYDDEDMLTSPPCLKPEEPVQIDTESDEATVSVTHLASKKSSSFSQNPPMFKVPVILTKRRGRPRKISKLASILNRGIVDRPYNPSPGIPSLTCPNILKKGRGRPPKPKFDGSTDREYGSNEETASKIYKKQVASDPNYKSPPSLSNTFGSSPRTYGLRDSSKKSELPIDIEGAGNKTDTSTIEFPQKPSSPRKIVGNRAGPKCSKVGGKMTPNTTNSLDSKTSSQKSLECNEKIIHTPTGSDDGNGSQFESSVEKRGLKRKASNIINKAGPKCKKVNFSLQHDGNDSQSESSVEKRGLKRKDFPIVNKPAPKCKKVNFVLSEYDGNDPKSESSSEKSGLKRKDSTVVNKAGPKSRKKGNLVLSEYSYPSPMKSLLRRQEIPEARTLPLTPEIRQDGHRPLRKSAEKARIVIDNAMQTHDTRKNSKSREVTKILVKPSIKPSHPIKVTSNKLQSTKRASWYKEFMRFVCSRCGVSFDTNILLTSHFQSCNEQCSSFPCGHCSIKFSTLLKLKEHLWKVHKPEHEEKFGTSSKTTSLEATSADGGTPYVCTLCKLGLKDKKAFMLHMSVPHLFRCKKCSFVCSTRSIMETHKEKDHPFKKVVYKSKGDDRNNRKVVSTSTAQDASKNKTMRQCKCGWKFLRPIEYELHQSKCVASSNKISSIRKDKGNDEEIVIVFEQKALVSKNRRSALMHARKKGASAQNGEKVTVLTCSDENTTNNGSGQVADGEIAAERHSSPISVEPELKEGPPQEGSVTENPIDLQDSRADSLEPEENDSMICEECGYIALTVEDARNHYRAIRNDGSLICEICAYFATTNCDLVVHTKNTHAPEQLDIHFTNVSGSNVKTMSTFTLSQNGANPDENQEYQIEIEYQDCVPETVATLESVEALAREIEVLTEDQVPCVGNDVVLCTISELNFQSGIDPNQEVIDPNQETVVPMQEVAQSNQEVIPIKSVEPFLEAVEESVTFTEL